MLCIIPNKRSPCRIDCGWLRRGGTRTPARASASRTAFGRGIPRASALTITAAQGRGPPASPPRPWNSPATREGRAPARPPFPLRPRRSAALPPRPPPLEFFGHAGGTRSCASALPITAAQECGPPASPPAPRILRPRGRDALPRVRPSHYGRAGGTRSRASVAPHYGRAGARPSRAEGFAITSISKSRRTLAPARMSSSVILGHL